MNDSKDQHGTIPLGYNTSNPTLAVTNSLLPGLKAFSIKGEPCLVLRKPSQLREASEVMDFGGKHVTTNLLTGIIPNGILNGYSYTHKLRAL